MKTNLDKYKSDLEKLIGTGNVLSFSIEYECYPEETKKRVNESGKLSKDEKKLMLEQFDFKKEYQLWYSESKTLLKQILLDRFDDFVKLFEKPKNRKDITFENYKIEDYLQGLTITRGYEKTVVVGPYAAIPLFRQQLNILKACERRFESSLFDIKQLVQADLFDSELDSAKELLKHKFYRASGAIAGVILEKHLAQACENHNITTSKKPPSINDYNELLKSNNIIETPTWRHIQLLGDIRNLCDHNKKAEPTAEQITDLIDGVNKIMKTIF